MYNLISQKDLDLQEDPMKQELDARGAEIQVAVDYILELTDGQVGAGQTPVSFLVASHREMKRQRDQLQAWKDEVKATSPLMQRLDLLEETLKETLTTLKYYARSSSRPLSAELRIAAIKKRFPRFGAEGK